MLNNIILVSSTFAHWGTQHDICMMTAAKLLDEIFLLYSSLVTFVCWFVLGVRYFGDTNRLDITGYVVTL